MWITSFIFAFNCRFSTFPKVCVYVLKQPHFRARGGGTDTDRCLNASEKLCTADPVRDTPAYSS